VALLAILVVANGALWVLYRNRTYPRTKVVGTNIGSVPFNDLSQKVNDLKLLPASLQLTYGQQRVDASFADLGITKDSARAADSARQQRSWLPMLNFFKSPELKAPISINAQTFAQKAAALASVFHKDPVNARLVLSGTSVTIAAAENGYDLQKQNLQQAAVNALDMGHAAVTVPVSFVAPKVTAASLDGAQKTLQNQLKTSVVFRYNGTVKPVSEADIAKWFVPADSAYTVSNAAILTYLGQLGTALGIHIKGAAALAASAQTAVANQKPLDATITAQTAAKTFTYCAAVKGVDASYLPGLISKLNSTYNDPRGWSMGGLIAFQEVSSGCDFTVWLTASNQMASFGDICDPVWSCTVPPNVVINFDRWQGATSTWNAQSLSLDEYRSLAIDHETGHWLGFGHLPCPGAGQPAPVMMQQSIDLQGCTFNAWPTQSELSTLKARLGITES